MDPTMRQPSFEGAAAGAGGAALPPPSPPPVFFTAGVLSAESSPIKSATGRDDSDAHSDGASLYAYGPPPATLGWAPAVGGATPHVQLHQPHHHQQVLQLQESNAGLQRQCLELQGMLAGALTAAAQQEAAGLAATASTVAAAAAAPPQPSPRPPPAAAAAASPRPAPSPLAAADGDDPAELQRVLRRLAAKQREAEAAAAAAEARLAQVARCEAELEAERAKSAGLSDEVARWRDECAQREREAKSAAQRLEAATAHAALLDNSLAVAKQRGGGLGTALAQRDAAIRQLEGRVRELTLQAAGGDSASAAATAEAEALRARGTELQWRNEELEAEVARLGAALLEARQQAAVAAATGHMYQQQQQYQQQHHHQQQQYEEQLQYEQAASRPHRPSLSQDAPSSLGLPSPAAPHGQHYSQFQHQQYQPLYEHTQRQQQWERLPGNPAHHRTAFQPHNQLAPAGNSYAGREGSRPDDACSVLSYGGGAPRLLPQQLLQRPPAPAPAAAAGHREEEAALLSQHLRLAASLQATPRAPEVATVAPAAAPDGATACTTSHASGSSSSPFGTEATLQNMLARTQALEDRLLLVNGERNELQAESARMPSHTTGRTLQERKRREAVERRLDVLNREASAIRLQLRRLGVK